MNFFLESFLRVTVVFASALLLTIALHRKPAALKHLVWTIAFAVALLTPLLLKIGPKVVRAPPAAVIAIAAPTIIDAVAPAPLSAQTSHRDWRPYALAIWIAGVVIFAARMLRGALGARALRHTAVPIEIFRGTPVAESEASAVAMTIGVRRPIILLSPEHRNWDCRRRDAVLLHELAHVRRRDCLLQWLPQIVAALHWFNPLVWIARSQMLCEAERACDDAVVSAGTRGTDFARYLLEIVQSASMKGADPMLISISTRFDRRITRLLNPSADRRPLTARSAGIAAAAILALLAPVAAIRAQDDNRPGSLSGIVIDPSGAVVPRAQVHIAGPSGEWTVAADLVGAWTLQNLPRGNYSIVASAPGFSNGATTISLAPGTSVPTKQWLYLGQIAESLTVRVPVTARALPAARPQRIRVGGMVEAARLINKIDPEYPQSARDQGIGGSVLIQAVIGKSGNILDARVLGDPPSPDLASAALAAVRTWQYEPTRLNGEPVEVVTTISVNFSLN